MKFLQLAHLLLNPNDKLLLFIVLSWQSLLSEEVANTVKT